ncbi:hypothetical protein BW730_00645 [Tessaracoccus aquimaris]|uniref:Glycosyl hydrolase n=1 Tax=Tessaracoccus aquimaris TaxID=1332264 RepID=A0A1Q2CJS6_9ACTN|nr:glycoside hydrolase family 76 protein [Tessaracoccus aquimaris]AQP46300.1 hypothetical protein BW730_00645 [Tessaracoccus aquimaris]
MSQARADEAARSVLEAFLQRPMSVPYLRLGAVQRPKAPLRRWDYWWQAHLLDCLVDARLRGSRLVDQGLINRQLTGIWVRNGFRYRNHYFDDMAWLSLAAQRAGSRRVRLRKRLESALTPDFGGGSFWRTDREYKATAATGPISLFLARAGQRRQAADLLRWLRLVLADESGLFRDGIRLSNGVPEVTRWVFTYNQGPALGTMLELGDDANLAAAARHIAAVGEHLVRPASRVLITHQSGDGGLFTGILTRYLALAANDSRLPDGTRALAGDLVAATAENLWRGREHRGFRGRVVTVFPQDTSLKPPVHTDVVELSTQLQAWMALEAAATLR